MVKLVLMLNPVFRNGIKQEDQIQVSQVSGVQAIVYLNKHYGHKVG